jgi:putative ABC transport system ATP-binding protein
MLAPVHSSRPTDGPASPTLLVVDDLVVEHANGPSAVRPIDGLSLQAAAGRITVVVGPSGSGKTTLLSCLATLLPATSGSVRVAGCEITRLTGAAAAGYRRTGVGIVFQAFNLIGSLTAREHVLVPLRAAGVGRRAAGERADALLQRVGLGERASYRPAALSGGQQQRVAIARALANDPPLVLADEPTAHLDPRRVSEVVDLLRSLADEGRSLVVATHDERLVAVADHVVDLGPSDRARP